MVNRATIVTMAENGVRPKAIAQQLACHPNTVYGTIREARKAGANIPHFKAGKDPEGTPVEEPQVQHFVVPLRLRSLLEREADRKNKTVQEMAQRLLEDALLGRAARHV